MSTVFLRRVRRSGHLGRRRRVSADREVCPAFYADRAFEIAHHSMDDPLFSPAFFWMWNAPLDAAALCAQLEDMRAHGLRNALEVTVANLLANQVGDDAIRDRVLRDYRPNGCYDNHQRPFDKHNHESGLYGPACVFAIGNGTTGDKTN